MSDKCKRAKRILSIIGRGDAEEMYNEFVQDITEDEKEYYQQGLEDLRFTDPFLRSYQDRE